MGHLCPPPTGPRKPSFEVTSRGNGFFPQLPVLSKPQHRHSSTSRHTGKKVHGEKEEEGPAARPALGTGAADCCDTGSSAKRHSGTAGCSPQDGRNRNSDAGSRETSGLSAASRPHDRTPRTARPLGLLSAGLRPPRFHSKTSCVLSLLPPS